MSTLLVDVLLFPFKLAVLIIEVLGRSLAVLIGLIAFGIGAVLCMLGPLILIGAPLCLLSAIVVIKAL